MQDKIIRRILAVFAIVSAILIFVALASVRNINRAAAGSDWVNHTHAVIMEFDALRSAYHAGDGALRTHLLTGDARDLAEARESFSEMSEHFEVARALVNKEAGHAERIARLETLLNGRMEFARAVVAAREQNDEATVRSLLAAAAGGDARAEISRLVEKIKDEEKIRLTERDKISFLQAQSTRWTVWGGLAVNFLLLAGAAWLIRDDIAARKLAAATLEEANATLETKVRERTAELVASNEKLLAENQERQWSGQALEHQLRYNQLIINSISDLVLVLTKMCNISRVNPAVTLCTGRSAADLINKPLAQVVRLKAADGSDVTAQIAQSLGVSRELHEQVAEILASDGRTIPARLSMFPLRDRDKVVGAVVTIRVLSNT
jgi:PAS domain S-box-containing protein